MKAAVTDGDVRLTMLRAALLLQLLAAAPSAAREQDARLVLIENGLISFDGGPQDLSYDGRGGFAAGTLQEEPEAFAAAAFQLGDAEVRNWA